MCVYVQAYGCEAVCETHAEILALTKPPCAKCIGGFCKVDAEALEACDNVRWDDTPQGKVRTKRERLSPQ